MAEKQVLLTRHATQRYVSLNISPDTISKTVRDRKRIRLGRGKWSATGRTKRGTIVVIFAESPEFIKVITITKGKKSP